MRGLQDDIEQANNRFEMGYPVWRFCEKGRVCLLESNAFEKSRDDVETRALALGVVYDNYDSLINNLSCCFDSIKPHKMGFTTKHFHLRSDPLFTLVDIVMFESSR